MIDIKEEVDEVSVRREDREKSASKHCDSDDIIETEENEDSLNNNLEKDALMLKVETDDNFSYDDDDKLDEERDRPPSLSGMSPVETATLLLLSRIALFNKVRQKNLSKNGKSFKRS